MIPSRSAGMGFLQINIGLIFLVLYFSMLSLMQILKLRRQTRSFDILCSLGKSQTGAEPLAGPADLDQSGAAGFNERRSVRERRTGCQF